MMPVEIAPLPMPALPANETGSREKFLAALQTSLSAEAFVKLVLAKHVGPEPALQQVAVRPVTLRGAAHLSLTYRYQTKDVTKNLEPVQALATIASLVGASFRNAHLLTATHTIELATNKRGEVTLRSKAALHDAASSREHNRVKRRFVELDRPFLVALGVTDANGRLIPAMSRKWKQIDKFIEVFSNALAASALAAARTIRVMDFGAGKGYLTFALHDYLRHTLGVKAHVTGVDLREDMVQLTNGAARRLGVEGLDFQQGDVTRYALAAIDVMIALHACDTATDHAIHAGIAAGAAIIVCAPCCHKEVRAQLLSPHPLRAILKHGVHLGQEAEMVTDGLRALLLEASGYATQVFEFVALEHTSKNKMILAVKRANGETAEAAHAALDQVEQVKQFYGIREQRLARLLAARPGSA
ncbi:MAG: class I SAM-dependent methyltransferase [Burkholderiales bacterium]